MHFLFSMPGTSEWIYLAIIIVYWVVVLSKVKRTLLRGDISLQSKLIWSFVLLFIPVIGLAIYNFSDISKPAVVKGNG